METRTMRNDYERIIALASDVASAKEAYDAGYDRVVNGANDKNCALRFFRSQELTRAWESGGADAEADRAEKV
jgi:hypothetical protein